MANKCEWHRQGILSQDGLSCPDCGRLLAEKTCEGCGESYLEFNGGYDDVVAGAAVTSSGDLICVRCVRDYDQEDEDGDDYDFDVEDSLTEDGL